ncbi:WXG100 family type VII secretion target [Paenibacillus barcinonensis]|uniref:WXG100 family type VII secretion target n=1 Tax=Paenibacillus barcinonensis TaxID=198119 RepID=A0A2V4UZF8_PAEBA|nr:WXG100 family type VII secretion target [Paenibacillus barcinonensis]PYE41866.1 WXG100 family type VII secretion target [Paenibacillus barcinonensis]QKS56158.1 WXG100 family type VII secretion target [Paenibacillus barcinonensis]
MSRIQVTPERLFEAAREVEENREQMEDTREELVRLIRWMESMWSGIVRERFLERFEENQPRMIETLESLAQIAKELREIGVRFQQADEVSGAAIAGNVAMKSIGLKATQSNDDKGYQMKYDTYLRIWLPVNENGVTDQAALQAYERDHGKIDVTKMGQPPGANSVPEQDLIQLQIEAFELGVNPFTGEPVTDDYAKMMISSLKWSQIVAGIGMVTGSMKSGKGPYKGRGTSAALDKVKQTIRDAKAKREQAGKSGKGTGQAKPKVYNAEGNPDLRATRRPAFDEMKDSGVTANGQTYKMNEHAYSSLFKSGRKDIMPDDITDALATKPKPAEAGSVEYVNPATGTSVFVNPSSNQIVGVWPSSFKR